MKKYLLGTITGVILTLIIGASASYLYNAKDIEFNASSSEFEATNVEDALNEIYGYYSNKDYYVENIYSKTIPSGYGENLNLNYTVPENVTKMIVVITRTFAYCTFQDITFSGDGLNNSKLLNLVSNGSYQPYNYTRSYILDVVPNKSINIKTNETNLSRTQGLYSSYVNVYYLK